MPFRFEDGTTPAGRPCLLVDVSGHVSLADAESLGAHVQPGARYHNQRVLTRVARGTEYSPESRKYFPTMNDKYVALAAVVTSPIVRAAINLMVRLTRNANRFRMFNDEAEAMAWLDAQR